jgi:hypothetical protein
METFKYHYTVTWDDGHGNKGSTRKGRFSTNKGACRFADKIVSSGSYHRDDPDRMEARIIPVLVKLETLPGSGRVVGVFV